MTEDEGRTILSWINTLPEVPQLHSRSAGRKAYANNIFIHGRPEIPIPEHSPPQGYSWIDGNTYGKSSTFAEIQATFQGPTKEEREDSVIGEKFHDEEVLLESHYGYIDHKIIRVPEITLTAPREDPETDAFLTYPEVQSTTGALVTTVGEIDDMEPRPPSPIRRRNSFEHSQPIPNITNLILWSAGNMKINEAIVVWNMLKQARRMERHCGDIPAAVEIVFSSEEASERDSLSQLPLHAHNYSHVDTEPPREHSAYNLTEIYGTAGIKVHPCDDTKGATTVERGKELPLPPPSNHPIQSIKIGGPGSPVWVNHKIKEDIIFLNFDHSWFTTARAAKRRTIDFHNILQPGWGQEHSPEKQRPKISPPDISDKSCKLPNRVPEKPNTSCKDFNKLSVAKTQLQYRVNRQKAAAPPNKPSSLPRLSRPSQRTTHQKTIFDPNAPPPYNRLLDTNPSDPYFHQNKPLLDLNLNIYQKKEMGPNSNSRIQLPRLRELDLPPPSQEHDNSPIRQNCEVHSLAPIGESFALLPGIQDVEGPIRTTLGHYRPRLGPSTPRRSPSSSQASNRPRGEIHSVPTTPIVGITGSEMIQKSSPSSQVWPRADAHDVHVRNVELQFRRISDSLGTHIEALQQQHMSATTIESLGNSAKANEAKHSASVVADENRSERIRNEIPRVSSPRSSPNGGGIHNGGRIYPTRIPVPSNSPGNKNTINVKKRVNKVNVSPGPPTTSVSRESFYADRCGEERRFSQRSIPYYYRHAELAKEVPTNLIEPTISALTRSSHKAGEIESPVRRDNSGVNPLNSDAGGVHSARMSAMTQEFSIGSWVKRQDNYSRLIHNDESVCNNVAQLDPLMGIGSPNILKEPSDTELESNNSRDNLLPTLEDSRTINLKRTGDSISVDLPSTPGGYGAISQVSSPADLESAPETDTSGNESTNPPARNPSSASDYFGNAAIYIDPLVSIGYQHQPPMKFIPTSGQRTKRNCGIFTTVRKAMSDCLGMRGCSN